jgi:hypothetical protein
MLRHSRLTPPAQPTSSAALARARLSQALSADRASVARSSRAPTAPPPEELLARLLCTDPERRRP